MRVPYSIPVLIVAAAMTGVSFGQAAKDTEPPSKGSDTEKPKSRGLLQDLGGKASGEVHKQESNAAKESHKQESNAAKESHTIQKNVSSGLHHVTNVTAKWSQEKYKAALAKWHASWAKLDRYAREKLESLFMQEPHFVKVNPGRYTGSPVYYINGMLTKSKHEYCAENANDFAAEAYCEALALAYQVKRPVYLIRNPTVLEGSTGTPSCVDDFSEAVYDKVWPEELAGADLRNFFGGLSAPTPRWVQMNPTTKQITWIRAKSLVSHARAAGWVCWLWERLMYS
jgi:hypothetical protein